jgi:hypothetical protein
MIALTKLRALAQRNWEGALAFRPAKQDFNNCWALAPEK